jgi:hypothetical protein
MSTTTNYSSEQPVTATTIIASLSLLDERVQDAVARIIIRIGMQNPWLNAVMQEAIREQLEREADYTAWLDYEATKYDNRFALEK